MKKAIVTTTINPPTEALKKFIKIADADEWHLFIVGDQKTVDKPYYDIDTSMDCVTYLDCEAQEGISKKLSDLIGWNCIQRRNFGLIAAYQWGAEVIATIDDDNIPYPNWGKNVKVNQEYTSLLYHIEEPAFDPLSPMFPSIWHRGFPLQLLDKRHLRQPKLNKRKVLVQADLWDDDPDIDAIARIAMAPSITFNPNLLAYGADKPAPFNSQNTFLSREIFPTYFLFPHIGRMDDIWAAYITEAEFGSESVIFSKASVHQARNPHDLVNDLEAEMLGYKYNEEIVNNPDRIMELLPAKSAEAYRVYKELFSEKAN